MNPKKIILSDAVVKAALAVALPARAKYVETMKSLEIPLHPADALQAAKQLLTEAKSDKEIAAAQARLFSLSGEAAEAGRVTARRLSYKALAEFTQTLPALVDAASAALNREVEKAKAAEQQFFAAHSLPHEPTSVSRRFASLVAEVATLRACLTDKSPAAALPPSRGTFAHVVQWFTEEGQGAS